MKDRDNNDRIKKIQEHSLYYLVTGENDDKSETNGWWAIVERSIITKGDLRNMIITEVKCILSPWLCPGSLGYIFGMRGVGKTWLALKMAINISIGDDFGTWRCGGPRKTLYIDGEMSLKAMKSRIQLLEDGCLYPENLMLMSNEAVVKENGEAINLCAENHQSGLVEFCVKNGVEVVFIDNLSCLFLGMRENDADDWEKVAPWLLKFRQKGIAVVILHHSNRDGSAMRGTSRREDAASWILKVAEKHSGRKAKDGTFFTTTFTKNRDDGGNRELSTDWEFVTQGDRMVVSHSKSDTKTLIYDLIVDGLESCSDIAEELGITKVMVSRHVADLIEIGMVKKRGKSYILS
jgi:hypothetical protein